MLAPLWNLSRHDRTLLLGASGRPAVTSGHTENIAMTMNNVISVSGQCFAQRPVIALVTVIARATIGHVRYLRCSIRLSLPSPFFIHFFAILVTGLLPIFVLGLCLISWVFSSASKVLLMVLIIESSRCLCPSHVLSNSLVQCGCVDHKTPKSKVNGPRVHFPYRRLGF